MEIRVGFWVISLQPMSSRTRLRFLRYHKVQGSVHPRMMPYYLQHLTLQGPGLSKFALLNSPDIKLSGEASSSVKSKMIADFLE